MDADEAEGEIPDLHDLVPVVTARSPAEAAFLVGLLEDAEIPAVSQGESLSMLQGIADITVYVSVPRSLRTKAREVIERRQAQGEATLVDHAFHEAGQQEVVDESEGELAGEMIRLSNLPPEERDTILRKHLADWLVDGTGSVEIARNLSLAGLTREEADALVADVGGAEALLEKARNEKLGAAYLFALLGGIGFIFTLIAILRGYGFRFVMPGVLLFGISLMYIFWIRNRKPIRGLPNLQKEQETD